MRFFRKRTDEELVERIRRGERFWKYLILVDFVCAAAAAAATIWLQAEFKALADQIFPNQPGEQTAFKIGLVLGGMAGLIAASSFFFCIEGLVAINVGRTHRLLLRLLGEAGAMKSPDAAAANFDEIALQRPE
jgi:hypothetical protein